MAEQSFLQARHARVESVRLALREQVGAFAQIWHYTTSHRHLEIRLEMPDSKGNLHLICEDCSSIAGPTSWRNADLTVDYRESTDTFEVTDLGGGFKVVCGLVSVAVDVAPVY